MSPHKPTVVLPCQTNKTTVMTTANNKREVNAGIAVAIGILTAMLWLLCFSKPEPQNTIAEKSFFEKHILQNK